MEKDIIITVDDIKRETDNKNNYRTVGLPFWLEWFYDKKDKRLCLYNKQTDIVKHYWLTHREASSIIFWVIVWYENIRDKFFNLWIIE